MFGCFSSYYEYIWQRTKGMSFGSLFNGMPKSLQADISLSLYKKIIDEVTKKNTIAVVCVVTCMYIVYMYTMYMYIIILSPYEKFKCFKNKNLVYFAYTCRLFFYL